MSGKSDPTDDIDVSGFFFPDLAARERAQRKRSQYFRSLEDNLRLRINQARAFGISAEDLARLLDELKVSLFLDE